MKKPHRYTDLALLWRLFHQGRTYWPHLGALFLLDLASIPLALLSPLGLKIAVDSALGTQPLPGLLETLMPRSAFTPGEVLILAVGLVLVIAVLNQLQGFGSWLLRTYVGERLVMDFRTQLFSHAQRISFSYHDTQGSTDSIYRIQYDTSSIRWVLVDGLIPFVILILTLFSMVSVTVHISWQLALVALSAAPVIFLVTEAYRPRLRDKWTEVKDLESSALSVIQEVLGALRVVKAFGQEDREKDRFVRRFDKSVWAQVRVVLAESGFNFFVGLAIAAGTAAVLFVGSRQVLAGSLTLGDLLLVMAYLVQLYGPLGTIGQRVAGLQGSLASAERAFTLLDEEPDVVDQPHAIPITRARGIIEFRNVSFGYAAARPVLQGVSFKIDAGTRVGIVGRTGAGKTTLMSLLMRFYDPGSGQILLDGVDIRDYRLRDLRNQFSIVLQEPVLFSTSIAENIAYARPGAKEKEVMEAAKAAHAHEFIASLPRGYDSPVGERGLSLSGGERQRIALARAFLKNAPVLILDEPTSSVDVRTENVIIEALERLMKNRTTFMIAHRLSTLRQCDLLLDIDDELGVTACRDVRAALRERASGNIHPSTDLMQRPVVDGSIQ